MSHKIDKSIFVERRKVLVDQVSKKFSQKTGIIVFTTGFERDHGLFRPDASAYYLTGIEDPNVVIVGDLATGRFGCFVPACGLERNKWMGQSIYNDTDNPEKYGLDFIRLLGNSTKGYHSSYYFNAEDYCFLINHLSSCIKDKQSVYAFYPSDLQSYLDQVFLLQRLSEFIPFLREYINDISGEIAQLRRKKSKQEIEKIYKAVEITVEAHACIMQAIRPGMREYELRALIEYVFNSNEALAAFPSIVASGKASTILHYRAGAQELQSNDMLVVDIGAEYQMYCADITRTYPVSKKFTKAQRTYYDIVLKAQEYIASLAQPGYWISNKDCPEKSLQHLAVDFFKQHNVAEHFWHGIGHFLGLDVHDVGNRTEPLQEGDVITIEPGLYLPEEKIGIRIEDNYWITEQGALCLSESLEKHPDFIEKMMKDEQEKTSKQNKPDA